MSNLISINFIECDPAPSKGYNVKWRVYGSGDPYTDQGNFYGSPAVFTDPNNPPGTIYEGTITAQGVDINCNEVPWNNFESPQGSSSGNISSCGTLISKSTANMGYTIYGYEFLYVDGASQVDLAYDVLGRPNRITLYDNGFFSQTTGWKGTAPYFGPWGASLSTPSNGVLSFNPIPGHEYKLLLEAGPAGPSPYDVTDNIQINVLCTF